MVARFDPGHPSATEVTFVVLERLHGYSAHVGGTVEVDPDSVDDSWPNIAWLRLAVSNAAGERQAFKVTIEKVDD